MDMAEDDRSSGEGRGPRYPKDSNICHWGAWELHANGMDTLEETDSVYAEAIEALPECPELIGNYAIATGDGTLGEVLG